MKKLLFLCLVPMLIYSCKRDLQSTETPQNPTPNNPNNVVNSMLDLKVPNGFNYETTRDVNVNLTLLDADGQPIKKGIVMLMDNSRQLGGKVLMKGATDDNGAFTALLTLPTYLTEVVINTSNLSIPRDVIVGVNGTALSSTLGGPNFSPRTVVNPKPPGKTSLGKAPGKFSTRLGTWNTSTGRPNYLESVNDVVNSTFLNAVNALVPEGEELPDNHPTFLNDDIYRRNLLLTGTADVFVTFVSEGADYKNTLFYYVYNKNNPPTTVSQIDSFIVIFPNTSFNGSGGNLATGNKVKIGRWGADTIVAFGILADGFDGSTLNLSKPLFFGNKALNPETSGTTNIKQHLALVYEPNTQRFVLCFEDINRDPGTGCDHDFNDVLYYATANPIGNCSMDNICNMPDNDDTDNDGVDDNNDDYPTDNTKAFNNYYPSSTGTATVAFEDLWYYKGDYDLNDVVMDVRTNAITNASNNVVRFEGKYWLRASGGDLKSAFAIQYPTTRGNVTGVTGGTLEAGQTNAVIQLFNNVRAQQQMWNTIAGQTYSDSVQYSVAFNLTTKPALSAFGVSAYDPFLWINETAMGRGWEIHLPGKTQTNLANTALFGLGDDDTQISGSKKYLSKTNLPWAISIPEKFDYPKEKADITQTYTHFATWAQSGGTLKTDWYKNLSGYRNSTNIYVRP